MIWEQKWEKRKNIVGREHETLLDRNILKALWKYNATITSNSSKYITSHAL